LKHSGRADSQISIKSESFGGLFKQPLIEVLFAILSA